MEFYNVLIIQQNIENIENIENNENVENIENVENVEECFICFEVKKIEEIPKQLKYQKTYLKFCYCDGWVHDSCLKTWFNINEKCPICRNIMIEKNCVEVECSVHVNYFLYNAKIFFKKIIHNIIRVINVIIIYVTIINIIDIISVANKYKK
jgi:hypothetical protein